jgi:quinohemoprotein ethanol dehydrogenase
MNRVRCRSQSVVQSPLLAVKLSAAVLAASLTIVHAEDAGVAKHFAATKAIDGRTIQGNAATTKDWPSHGLDYAETRFSKLDQIHENNVGTLGFAWSYDLESSRGVEATPLVVDGIMYVTASWSVVHAIDVRSGRKIWSYDPEVPRNLGYKGCCDVVNRGVALWKGKVYVASYDGRLIALDAATGGKVWEKDTIIDHSHSYTSTGAPRIYKGMVFIGNSGAEYGARGYVTAYDAQSGEQKWRWFVVPGDPSKPFEDKSMEVAAKTWDPSGKYWINGGGGAPWDSMAFDPELNLIYIGTGDGGPWDRNKRSPAGGDNLYVASIVALNPDTGEYVWHYQETPGESWDYDSTQSIILADIPTGGKTKKVILQAAKNGFFFVIDRTNGHFLSAQNFVDVNWATGYDANGRPLEVAAARQAEPFDAIPGPSGAHNWQSMSFSPLTGLAYIPAQTIPVNFAADNQWRGQNSNNPGEFGSGLGWNLAVAMNTVPPKGKTFGRLIAWDPVKQSEAWRQEYGVPSNGGTLVTAGNLVFQGTADGRFVAYNAKSGDKLWESPLATGAVAAPVTYMVDGKQYVSIAVGWGGVYGLSHRATEGQNPGAVYTFVLSGTAPLPAVSKYQMSELLEGVQYKPADVSAGAALYVSNCVQCHGVPAIDNGGSVPNLAYIGPEPIEALDAMIFNGPFVVKGMPDFTGKLTVSDVDKIKAFIQATADSVRAKK